MAGLLSKRGYDVRYAGFKNSQSEIVISTLLFCKKMAGGLYMELNSGPLVTDDAYLEKFYQSLKTMLSVKAYLNWWSSLPKPINF